jgi:chaperonin GroEL
MNRSANHVGDVVFPPCSRQALLRGVKTVVETIRPTLGPLPRSVAVTPPPGTQRPIEFLDDGGLIARRIVALPNRDQDAGAMLVRHVVWHVRERIGDGSATAAVLFGAIFAGGIRAIEAGADPGRLRAELERGARIIVDELTRSARHVDGREALERISASLCGDAELATTLGEVFDVVGPDGGLEVRPAYDRGIQRQYVSGTFWEGGLLARGVGLHGANERVLLRDAAIAVTDLEIDALPELLALLDRSRSADIRALVIVAQRISDRALGLLLANDSAPATGHEPPSGNGGFRVTAVRAPGSTPDEQFATLEDLALLCGGQPILAGAGQTLAAITPAQLGHARRAWATQRHFGVEGGSGDPALALARIDALRQAVAQAATVDEREKLQRRIGKLMATTAVVNVGGVTEREGKARRELARRTAIVLREAMRCGLVPGGGTALLACRQRLSKECEGTVEWDRRAALAILLAAVEEPFRTIVANAGHDPERSLHRVAEAPSGHGFDALRGEVVEMIPAGIVDAVSVQRMAVETAISAAALACTIGIVVHPKRREVSAIP